MMDYKTRITECIAYLRAIRFPSDDWKKDKIYFDQLEAEFAQVPVNKETGALLDELKKLIREKRVLSLRCNKTTEELYAGWNDD
jgi:hypothetical protein